MLHQSATSITNRSDMANPTCYTHPRPLRSRLFASRHSQRATNDCLLVGTNTLCFLSTQHDRQHQHPAVCYLQPPAHRCHYYPASSLGRNFHDFPTLHLDIMGENRKGTSFPTATPGSCALALRRRGPPFPGTAQEQVPTTT